MKKNHYYRYVFIALLTANYGLCYAGSLDTSFGNNGIVTTIVGSSSFISFLSTTGNQIAAGGATTISGVQQFAVALYNSDGSLDTTFGTNGIVTTIVGTNSRINDISTQQDGKIVAGGFATVGTNRFALARYNLDGSLDTTFGTNGIVTTAIGSSANGSAIDIQPDGKIIIAGNGGGDWALARYNTDGSLDTSFGTNGIVTTGIGVGESIGEIALQEDGKIIAGGFTTIGGVVQFAVARYNVDGSLDTTFGTNGITTTIIGTFAIPSAVGLQSTNKIIAAGTATIGGISQFTLARYNSDGSLDTTFGTNGIATTIIGTTSTINSVAIQRDDKIIAAGVSTISGVVQFTFARYYSDGSLDTTFGTNGIVTTIIGTTSVINAVLLTFSNSKILIGGSAIIDGVQQMALARYLNDIICTGPLSCISRSILSKYCGLTAFVVE